MKMDKVNLVGYIAIIIIILSLATFGFELTGRVTDTAQVNVTIESTANLQFTDAVINFSSGRVDVGQASATLISNHTEATNGNWTWSADELTLENLGNVNLTVNLKSDKTADSLLNGTSPVFQYSVNSSERSSCVQQEGGITLIAWNDVNVTGLGTVICNPMGFENHKDLVTIYVKLVVPSDAAIGSRVATFTATGTAAS